MDTFGGVPSTSFSGLFETSSGIGEVFSVTSDAFLKDVLAIGGKTGDPEIFACNDLLSVSTGGSGRIGLVSRFTEIEPSKHH